MKEQKPCKFAVKVGDVWRCICHRHTYCADQITHVNPDESDVVVCGYAKRREKDG